jgi:hypothetical protein
MFVLIFEPDAKTEIELGDVARHQYIIDLIFERCIQQVVPFGKTIKCRSLIPSLRRKKDWPVAAGNNRIHKSDIREPIEQPIY